MADTSHIEWTDATWNPVTGCRRSAPAASTATRNGSGRLKADGAANYRNGFELTLQPHMLELPLRWKSPRRSSSTR